MLKSEKIPLFLSYIFTFFLFIRLDLGLSVTSITIISVISLIYILFDNRYNIYSLSLSFLILLFGGLRLLFSQMKGIQFITGDYIIYFIFITAILLFSKFKTLKTINRLLKFIVFCILVSSIWGVLTYFFEEPFLTLKDLLIENYDPENQKHLIYQGAPISGLSNSVVLFSYILILLPFLSLYLYKVTKSKLYLFIIIFAVFSLFLNGERSSLGFVIIFLTFASNEVFGRKTTLKLFSLLVFLFLLTITIEYSGNSINPLYNRFFSEGNYVENETINTRLERQLLAIESISKSPILGPSYDEYYGLLQSKGLYLFAPHNSFLLIGFQTGLIGIVFSIVFITYIYKKRPSNFSNEILNLSYIIKLMVLALVFNSLFHNAGPFNSGEEGSILAISLLISITNIKISHAKN